MTQHLMIVAWHSVGGTWAYPSSMGAALRGFEYQVSWLARFGTVVPLSSALCWLATGQPLPPRAVALTFDDGYQDNLDAAVPVLERFGLPATFFLVPGILSGDVRPWWETIAWAFARSRRAAVVWEGRSLPTRGRPGRRALDWTAARLKMRDKIARQRSVAELVALLEPDGELDTRELFLTWEGARDLIRRGFSVGAHSREHATLSRESAEAQLEDLVTSRRQLEDGLGVVVDLLAYPNGLRTDYDANTVEAARRAGFTHALTARPGWNTSTTPQFEIRRVVLDPTLGFSQTVVRRVTGKLVRVGRDRLAAVASARGPT